MTVSNDPDLSYEDYMRKVRNIQRGLNKVYKDLAEAFLKTTTSNTLPVAHINQFGFEHYYNLDDHPPAQEELARQLNQGLFPQYFREIMTLHPTYSHIQSIMEDYAGLNISPYHHYDLIVNLGVEGSRRDVPIGAFVKSFEIAYSNDLGMHWSLNTKAAAVTTSIGIGGNLGIESSLDGSFNTGYADTPQYYPPNYFRSTSISATTAELDFPVPPSNDPDIPGSVRVGAEISRLSFGEVEFDTSSKLGEKLRITDSKLLLNLGLTVGLGLSKGGNAYERKGLGEAEERELKPRRSIPKAKIISVLYFRTQETELDYEDHEILDSVVNSIINHDKFYPGDLFIAFALGFASESWGDPGEYFFSKDRLNKELAEQRSQVAIQELKEKLNSNRPEFSVPDIIDESRFLTDSEVRYTESPEQDQNSPINRGVNLVIAYTGSLDDNLAPLIL